MRRNATAAEDYAARHNVPRWTSDASAVIDDPEVNAVYVATPPRYHAMYAMMAARAGKAVYVEKPMGVSYLESKHLLEVAAANKVPVFVAYYRRALPNFLKVKELIDSGRIGKVRAVHVQYHRPPNQHDRAWAAAGGLALLPGASLLNASLQWRTDPLVGGRGGYFRDKGSHQLDLLDFWFGPLLSGSGFASNQEGLYPAEDTVVAQFKFASGVVGTGSWCFSSEAHQEFGEVVGSSGRIRFQFFKSNKIQIWTTSKDEYEELDVPSPPHVQQPLLETVVSALRGDADCPSTGQSAARTNQILDNIVNGVPWP
eukprot:SM000265S09785  [mRNA]  locus=s265:125002:126657:- [translate_table: standard]